MIEIFYLKVIIHGLGDYKFKNYELIYLKTMN